MSNILNTIKIKTSRDLIEEPIFLRCDSVRDGAVELTLDAQNADYNTTPIPADAEGGIITAIVTLLRASICSRCAKAVVSIPVSR